MSDCECECKPMNEKVLPEKKFHYIEDHYVFKDKIYPKVKTLLSFKDRFDSIKVRWGWNRMGYSIKPGLYALGNPDETSAVLVSANYKLTFDHLRKELSGLNLWILILDTKAVNVWCAAGKGTFGTNELINKINNVGLDQVITHKKIILPQLGAVGVKAHEITKSTGFQVIYGPVYAHDIPNFLKNNLSKDSKMKKIHFNFYERLVLVPIEIVGNKRLLFILLGIGFILEWISLSKLSFSMTRSFIPLIGAFLAGTVLGPVLLPYFPFASFALKGYLIGLIWIAIYGLIAKLSIILFIAYALALPVITSYLTLNFTGASTFTHLTGVKFEIKLTTPVFLIFLFSGFTIKLLNALKVI